MTDGERTRAVALEVTYAPPQWAHPEHTFREWVPAARRADPPKPNDADRYLHRTPHFPWAVTAPCGARQREGMQVAAPWERPDCPNCALLERTPPPPYLFRESMPELTRDDLNDLPRVWFAPPGYVSLPGNMITRVAPRPHCPACGVHQEAEVWTEGSVMPGAPYIAFRTCGHAWAIVDKLAPAQE
jgi:hypothetical protein